MYLDLNALFTSIDGDSIIANSGSAAKATKSLDLGAAGEYSKISIGGDLIKVMFQIITAVVGTGASVTFRVITSASPTDFTSAFTTIVASGAIPRATLVAGYRTVLSIPRMVLAERYMCADALISGANVTAGSMVAGIVWDDQNAGTDWSSVTGFPQLGGV